MTSRILTTLLLLCSIDCGAQECAGAPSYTSEQLEARGAPECNLTYAPACQRIRPASSDAIFIGTVLKITESDGQMLLNGDCSKTLLQTVTVKVDESFVGGQAGTVTIKAGDINGFYFRSRQKFLVVAKRLPDGTLTVTSCGGTKKITDAAEDIAYLRSWPNRPTGAELFGEAWIRVNKDNPERMVAFIARPLQSTKIAISGPARQTVETDKSGRYKVSNLPPGKYEVSIDVPYATYPAKSQTVDLVERGCAQVNFHVDPSASQAPTSSP